MVGFFCFDLYKIQQKAKRIIYKNEYSNYV